ncbi:MAG TPA: aminoacetone oxidase family FAD-binding enzyme [Thermoanaerobaculia bacterium]|nr:aminoacetone oxidase family FAD-binding enzyme [Thermoanaerobaculia bacterium]
MERGIVVVGAGAAGLMAARSAGEQIGRPGAVLLVEGARESGRKILVSGGGRCNVLPAEESPERFVSASPGRLVRRFLDRWPLAAQREFFEELLGGPLREETESGKLFPPTNRARDVRDALQGAARRAGAVLRSGCPVRELVGVPGGFHVRLDGETIPAAAVVVATGGRSVLAPGADAGGTEWAAALGHTVRPTYPALAPLVGDAPSHHALAGVSTKGRVTARAGSGPSADAAVSEGGFLFTHRGWSGPAVLDVSHVVERASRAARRADVRVAFVPGTAWEEELRGRPGSRGSLSSSLRISSLPDRLVQLILATAGVADVSLSRLTREARRRVVDSLTAFPIPATGTEGYRTAEVTGGGVALEEVDPGSGESRLVPGLYFAGEILDAFGPIGGFNFQWAWATGRTAGEAAARRFSP